MRNIWRVSAFPVVCTMALFVTGCAAPYDQTTDDSLTKIQKEVDGHVSDLINSSPTTQPSTFDYNSVDAELHSLAVRVQARSSNDPSIKSEAGAIGEYKAVVDDLPQLERGATTRPVGAEAWKIAQSQLDAAMQAILALELQRKSSK